MGYMPEEPGTCKMMRVKAMAFPRCLNATESAKMMLRKVNEATMAARKNATG
jgi:hypothetical protein